MQTKRPPSESSDNDSCEEFSLEEVMNKMTVFERRRVYAMKGLLRTYRKKHREYMAEMAALEKAHNEAAAALREERRRVICGEREVTSEELASYQEAKQESRIEELPSDDEGEKGEKKDEEKDEKKVKIVSKDDEKADNELATAAARSDGGIPGFWLDAMMNHQDLEFLVTERDAPVLRHLRDITKTYVEGDPLKGFELHFHFNPNDYFSNETLSKRYLYSQDEEDQDEDEPILETIEGCTINWKSSEKNVTVVLKQKKQRHKSGKGVRVVTREEPCASFFQFFKAPVRPKEDDDKDEDEEEEDYDEQMEIDYETATSFADNLIPRAVHYYCGRSVEEVAAGLDEMSIEDEDGAEEDEEEEEEEEEEPPKKGKGHGGKGSSGAKGQSTDKSCKNQ